MLNKVCIQGNLVKDPELNTLPNWTEVLNFSVATNRRYKKGDEYVEEATFHRCVAFSHNAKFIDKNFQKGDDFVIEWRQQTREWEDKEGNKRQTTEIVVEKVEFSALNKIVVLWNLTITPELKEIWENSKVVNFTIATNRKYKKGDDFVDEATFHKCVAFWWQAEFIAKHFEKGHPIAVIWRIQIRDWEDKEGNKRQTNEIVVEEVSFAWKK